MDTITLFAAIVSAIATVVIAGATIVYVVVTRKLWLATMKTACRTEDLVKESRAQFKLHVLATYVQGRCAALALGDPEGRFEARTRHQLMLLKGLLRRTFPDQWEEIQKFEEEVAKDPGLREMG